MTGREEIKVRRDVDAVVIPAGHHIMIPEGVTVTLTQALGGHYTVITPHGYLARVAGQDADALGKEPTAPAAASTGGGPDAAAATPGSLEEQVWGELRTIFDPEIPVNIVDLGLVYGCRVAEEPSGARVEVEMTMTAPGCGMGDVLKTEAEEKIAALPGVAAAHVEIVWDPPWDQTRMSEAARLELGFG